MDIDAVPLGVDFVDHISEEIVGCSAVIVLIGWQRLTVTDKNGRARLSNEKHFVRTEGVGRSTDEGAGHSRARG